jgi:hypothetical protein
MLQVVGSQVSENWWAGITKGDTRQYSSREYPLILTQFLIPDLHWSKPIFMLFYGYLIQSTIFMHAILLLAEVELL